MKRFLLVCLMLFAIPLFAESYQAEVFKSSDKENCIELITEDGVRIELKNGEVELDEEDIITARGKAYVVIYIDKKTNIIIRKSSVKVKDLIQAR